MRTSNIQRRAPNTEREVLKAFTVKAHWELLIRSGLMTCENHSFRVPPGFYLVHASDSLSFSEWYAGNMWIADRFGTAIICPSFGLCRSWCGQIVCGITIVSALTASTNPWHLGDVAWEVENPVPFEQGVRVKGQLGVWLVSDDLRKRFREGVRALSQSVCQEHIGTEEASRYKDPSEHK